MRPGGMAGRLSSWQPAALLRNGFSDAWRDGWALQAPFHTVTAALRHRIFGSRCHKRTGHFMADGAPLGLT